MPFSIQIKFGVGNRCRKLGSWQDWVSSTGERRTSNGRREATHKTSEKSLCSLVRVDSSIVNSHCKNNNTLGAVVISHLWPSCVSPDERFITRACHPRSVSPQERFTPERCTFSKSVTPARCTPGAFHHRAFHPRGGLPQGRFSPELFTL